MATLLAALTLALVGCSDDDPEPEADPTPSTSTSTSVTPTPEPTPTGPVEPTLPPEARQKTAAGAIAFVKHYWAMADYAQLTGKVDGLAALASQNCRPCNDGVQGIRGAYADGAVIRGGTTTLSGISTSRFSALDRSGITVSFQVTSGRQVIDYPGDKSDEVHDAATLHGQALVERTAKGWAVMFLDLA